MTGESPTQLGEFTICGVLGRGGSGVVYDATWGPRRVALKVLHGSLAGTERVRAMFLGEARRLQAITHPSVVKVLAVGELPDGTPYLAMERLEGETLAHVLARGPLDVPEALRLFGELCAAVGALHDQGLVHRDLKPENVFVVSGTGAMRHVVLLDFGIAKELDAPASTTTVDGGVRGTPAYMAPERFFGQPAGVATDIYELAVTLYAMLAARLPWDDIADPEARLSPRPLTELAAVPPELDIEIRRALSTRAQNRPPSARAFLAALAQVVSPAPREQGSQADSAPSETARMRPAEPQGPSTPWFAHRQPTTERGKTPLAWAPTEPQRAGVPPPRRRRWPFVVAAIGTAGIVGGIIAWQLRDPDEPATPAAALAPAPPDSAGPAPEAGSARAEAALVGSDDPWAAQAERPATREAPTLSVTGPELSAAESRAQLARAIRHVPADTRVLLAVAISELRAHEQFAELLGKIRGQPLVSGFLASTPPCVGSVLAASQWAVFAAKTLDDSANATLILRGRWTRADIEKCFAEDAERLVMPDGKTMLDLQRVGWIDFVDDQTVYISVRDDLAAAQVHGLVTRGAGPTPHAQELLAKLPEDRTLAVVIDGSGKLEWPQGYLPVGSDVTAWMKVDTFTELELVADTHSVAEAKQLVAAVRPQFDEIFKEKESALFGKVEVTQAGTAMRIRGSLSSLLIAMISGQIP